jgi:hypothetical protein
MPITVPFLRHNFCVLCISILLLLFIISIQPLGQSGDRHSSGTLHSGQVLRGSLPLLSPAFRRSHFRRQIPPCPQQRERS